MAKRLRNDLALSIGFGILGFLIFAGCTSNAGPAVVPAEMSATAVAGATAPATAIARTTVPAKEPAVWVDTSPRLALPGQSITVSGYGFGPAEPVDVVVRDSGGREVMTGLRVSTDLRGGLPSRTTVRLPSEIVTGTYSVVVHGQSSSLEGATSLWVRVAPPAIQLSRDTLHPQDLLTIDGRGFVPRERVVIYLAGRGGDPLTAVTADQAGNLRVENVPIPLLEPGEQQVIATGAISKGQAARTVRLLPFEPVVSVTSEALPPGATAGFFGSGFAAADDIVINLEGSDALSVTLATDSMGRLNAPQAFTIPNNLKGQQTFALDARKTGKKLRVSLQVVPGYPIVELSGTSGAAGSQIGLAARGLRPRERVDIYLAPAAGARKKLATLRADDNGWLRADAQFSLPADTPPGLITIALDGEAARVPIRLKYNVTGS